ncbi:DUF3489 domain-containing protein [Aquibium sp. ELW1220]|uniref:DUF3489 domain-containing protein n=1 Tax=Aquibium sp. ELW1220 TaxID=2976766 RepID=UPI0025AFAB41|nr:DUF3489 domain-containing protein [Aquibium sp. ELW1220]MDN2584343.1 DUF3489 domain-containing protein [Aquibium sp. ELW1220]
MTTMPLSDTQAIILAAACARDDRLVFPVTASIKGGAVGNVCKSLLRRALIEEVAATDYNTVWRHDDELGPVTLRATDHAFQVLGIADGPDAEDIEPTTSAAAQGRRATPTKQDIMIGLLSRPEGASIAEIAERSGWLGHSIRGLMSGTLRKKLGLTISSAKDDTRGRVYKIEEAPSPVDA